MGRQAADDQGGGQPPSDAPAPGWGGLAGLTGRGGALSAALLLAFGIVTGISGGVLAGPVLQWPFGAALVLLPLWWSRTRASPPPWACWAFLAAEAGLLAVQPHVPAVVVLILIGTALAILRLPDRSALLFGAASLGLAMLAGLRQRVALGTNDGLVTGVVGYSVAFGALIASRQRLRHQWQTERLLADLAEEHRLLEAAHVRLAEHAKQVAALAASEERNRIAREIHDVLAHALTAIIVQAEAASVRLRSDPAAGADQVRTVANLAREALQEARLSVTAIRANPGAAGLDALRRLCEDAARWTGMRCAFVIRGAERPLPAPVALAAYRILQEALTNARRHGSAEQVEVALAFDGDAVTLSVVDGDAARAAAAGRGEEGAALHPDRAGAEPGPAVPEPRPARPEPARPEPEPAMPVGIEAARPAAGGHPVPQPMEAARHEQVGAAPPALRRTQPAADARADGSPRAASGPAPTAQAPERSPAMPPAAADLGPMWPDPVPGSGLRGMRERAEGLGGTLHAGPLPDGRGFRVRARLPLPTAQAAAPDRPGPEQDSEGGGTP